MHHRLFRAGAAFAVVALAAGTLPSPASANTSTVSGSIVRTTHGAVRGATASGVQRFLGIPYAAAPTGERRWQPPRQPAAWSGVRDATEFGDACPVLPSSNGPRSESEDCLVINVWRPATTPARGRDHQLPVHVFIHGGGLVNGSGAQNDESTLVREAGIIGVSFNYRLGVFGFLRTPGLVSENADAGNYGFLDQQAALHWVRRNIAAFGGNPDRVTVGGESAGGFSTCAHLVAPRSRGLFARAMIQSGSCASQTPARADPATTVACLRAAPVGRLLDASSGFSAHVVAGTPTLPEAPAGAVAAGRFHRVPLIVGANRDEMRTLSQGFIGADRAAYETFVRQTFGDRAADVLPRYPWPETSDQFTAAYLIGAIGTDSGMISGIGGCAQRELARTFASWTRTYAYEFAHRTGPGLTPIPGYVWGAGHAAELPYIWPSFNNGTPIAPLFDAGERRLAREMVQYWGAFTRYGRPHVPGQVHWPRYGPAGEVLSLRAGGDTQVISDGTYVTQHQCRFWATMPPIDLTA